MWTFTNTFCTDRVVRARGHSKVGFVVWNFPRGWKEEVHQRPRFYITHVVIGDFLTQRDGKSFGQTAVHLAFNDHRVDPGTAVIQSIEPADFCHACININVHDTNIGPKWIGHVGRIIIADRLKTWLYPRNRLIIRCKGDFLHCLELLRRAFDYKTVHIEFHVIIMNFQQIGRDHLCFSADFAPGHRRRSTSHWGRP